MITPLHQILAIACLTGLLADDVDAQSPPAPTHRTTIKISGGGPLREKQILSLLGDRLAFARSRPPTDALADDAAFMLRRLLENQGYPEPRVSHSISGNTIFLKIDAGTPLTLGSVFLPELDKEEAKRLSLLFSSVAQKRSTIGAGEPPFRESDIGDGLDLLLADLHSRGYWAAKATVEKRSTDPQTGEVKLVVHTDPGPLHHLATASFDGDYRVLAETLAAIAANSRGQAATTANINRLRSAVESAFRDRGFKNAGIRMSITPAGATLQPAFTITSGARFRRGELAIVGLQRTRRKSILRFSAGIESDYYDASEVERRINGLLATGAFSGIQLESTPRGEFLDATLIVEEGRARGTSFYGGFGNYDGAILGGRYYDRNFGGRLLNFSAGAEFNNRGVLGEIKLVDPWIDRAGSKLGGRLFSLTRDHDGYDKAESGASLSYTRMIAEGAPFTAELGWSWVDIEPDGIRPPALGDTNYSHLRLRVSQSLDRRDDPLLPTRGWHLSGSAEAGLASGAHQVGYLKLEGAASWHTPVGERHQLSLGLRGGTIYHSSEANRLPIDLRYFLGGPDSVRSFTERDLGPRAFSNNPLGGEAYWVFNAEYVHALAGPLKLVAFTDVGGLSPNTGKLGFDDVEVAAGLGLRLDLPVGPIRLEYGHNLTRGTNEPSGTWHLAIGIAF